MPTDPTASDTTTTRVLLRVDRDGPDEVVWLRTGPMEVGIVPALGGRILALRLGGHELLYRNDRLVDERLHRRPDQMPQLTTTMATWRNYGGDKTWPAPQGWDGPDQWAGPPDPVLDSGPYRWSATQHDGGGTVTMISEPDPRTGLTLERTVQVRPETTTVTVRSRLINTSSTARRWAPWNVLQLPSPRAGDAPGGWYAGLDDTPDPVQPLLAGTGLPSWSVADGVAFVPTQQVVGKLGLPGAAGWLVTVSAGHVLAQQFPVHPERHYPDGGSRAEVWLETPLTRPLAELGGLQPSANIVESEALGPLVDLGPGDSTDLTVALSVARGEGRPRGVTAAGVVLDPLVASTGGGRIDFSARLAATVTGPVTCAQHGTDGAVLAVDWIEAAVAGCETRLTGSVLAATGSQTLQLSVAGVLVEELVLGAIG